MTNLPAESAPKVLSATPRTRHRRLREQGRSDRSELFAVLRAGLVGHLGVIVDGAPMVVPTGYGFDDAQVYVHGSVASRSLTAGGGTACLTVTVLDGLVLARSVFEHAVNYRSAMIYAVPRPVTDPDQKIAGLRALSDHLAPGQWDYARRPSRKELAATTLLAMALDEASVKIRSGPPDDAGSPDSALGRWAGELPLASFWQEPVADPALPADIAVPAHIRDRAGRPAYCPDAPVDSRHARPD
jgi:nitroimidazol reductase NimA-like FMN-containing flavoprotein (pyridoxamine 5'-phosphate oxidase superfamily)